MTILIVHIYNDNINSTHTLTSNVYYQFLKIVLMTPPTFDKICYIFKYTFLPQ